MPDTHKLQPELEEVPQKGSEECDLAKPQGERPNVGLHARDRSENAIYRAPLCVSHFVIVSVVAVNEPKNVSFRSFHGVFAQRCRILRRVASVPQKSSRHRRESVFFRANPRGTAGRTLQKSEGGAFLASARGQKWHFSRVIGAQKRAPHRRKTHPQKWCAKNGPK